MPKSKHAHTIAPSTTAKAKAVQLQGVCNSMAAAIRRRNRQLSALEERVAELEDRLADYDDEEEEEEGDSEYDEEEEEEEDCSDDEDEDEEDEEDEDAYSSVSSSSGSDDSSDSDSDSSAASSFKVRSLLSKIDEQAEELDEQRAANKRLERMFLAEQRGHAKALAAEQKRSAQAMEQAQECQQKLKAAQLELKKQRAQLDTALFSDEMSRATEAAHKEELEAELYELESVVEQQSAELYQTKAELKTTRAQLQMVQAEAQMQASRRASSSRMMAPPPPMQRTSPRPQIAQQAAVAKGPNAQYDQLMRELMEAVACRKMCSRPAPSSAHKRSFQLLMAELVAHTKTQDVLEEAATAAVAAGVEVLSPVSSDGSWSKL